MISLFGGTFDPIHNGHLYIANEVYHAFSPEKIIFIPNRLSPHRDAAHANAAQRAEMVRLAIDGYTYFAFSDIELERPAPSYTIDTVKTITKFYPDDEMTLIVGADAYHHFTSWLHFEEILDYCKLIVVNRDAYEQHNSMPSRIDPDLVYSLNVTPCPIGATQIRERIAAGESIEGLVPKAVEAFITSNKLYQTR